MKKLLILFLIFFYNYSYSQSGIDLWGITIPQDDLGNRKSLFVDLGFDTSETGGGVYSSYINFGYRYSFENNINIGSSLKFIYESDGMSTGLEMPLLVSYKMFSHFESDKLVLKIIDLILPDEVELITGGYLGMYNYPEYLGNYVQSSSTAMLDNKYGYGLKIGMKGIYYIKNVGFSLSTVDTFILSKNIYFEEINEDGSAGARSYVDRMFGLNIGVVYKFGADDDM